MSVIIENPPETIRLEFQELDAGWHSLGECAATTSVGPRGFGALSVTGATASPAVRMALELYGETPLPWRWTRVEDGARFEGRMQSAGCDFGFPDADGAAGVEIDLVALETVKRVDVEEQVEQACEEIIAEEALDVSPEKLAALEGLAAKANEAVSIACRDLIMNAKENHGLEFPDAFSAVMAGGQDALIRIAASTVADADLTFAMLESPFSEMFAELAPVIIAERLLAAQPEGASDAG